MNIKIEKGVPVPPKSSSTSEERKALELMNVGDSFLTQKKRGSFSNIMNCYAKQTGKRFTTRTQPDGSIRVWRIE